MVTILKCLISISVLNRDDKVENLYGWTTGDNFKGREGSDYRALTGKQC